MDTLQSSDTLVYVLPICAIGEEHDLLLVNRQEISLLIGKILGNYDKYSYLLTPTPILKDVVDGWYQHLEAGGEYNIVEVNTDHGGYCVYVVVEKPNASKSNVRGQTTTGVLRK